MTYLLSLIISFWSRATRLYNPLCAVDTHMNLLIQMFGLKYVEELARSVGAIRHGYQGMENIMTWCAV